MARPGDPSVSDTTFALTGELDLHRADQFEAGLRRHAERATDPVIVDCSELTFIDSSGLGMLVEVHNETGKRLHLQHVSESCRKIFVLTGLDTMFELS